ncbi:MAG: zinc ribbon-containing protein [Pseudomonadota bacterium]
MIERVQRYLQDTEGGVIHTMEEALYKAREAAMTLGELTREEADEIVDALRRDVDDVALTMIQAEAGFRTWMETDLTVAEQAMLVRALSSADPTTLEWMLLRESWEERRRVVARTGQVAEAGSYECLACGEIIHLHAEGVVPPCPRCKGTDYRGALSAVM